MRRRATGRRTHRNAPRYTGVRTFARCPLVERPGRRRRRRSSASRSTRRRATGRARASARRRSAPRRSLLRPWHPALDVDVFAAPSVVDLGDLDDHARATRSARRGRSPTALAPLLRGGRHADRARRRPLDRARRAACARGARTGRSALVLLDAHADTWDDYYGERYFHGTPFRRAVEEGLLDPARSVLAGHARLAVRGGRPRATRARWASS